MKQDDVLVLSKYAIIIYVDSVAHTIYPHSNIYSVPTAADFHIVEAIPAKLSSSYPALSL